jgi:transposase
VYTVELYVQVRRAVQVEGMSEREAARQFGVARETVRKTRKLMGIEPDF